MKPTVPRPQGAAAAYQSLIDIEQNRLLYGSLPMALPVNVVLALLVAFALSGAVPTAALNAWVAGMVLVQLSRLLLYLGHRRTLAAQPQQDAALWLRRFRAGALASGLVWGGAALLLFPEEDIVAQLFLAMTLAAISAASISSLATDRVSLLGFVMPVLLPFALRLFLQGGQLAMVIGAMVSVFVVFIIASARRLQRQLEDNVELRARAIEREAALTDEQRLKEIITRVQLQFIREADRSQAFEALLRDTLTLTGSEYGFIADVLREPGGAPYLKTRALTNIAWSEETRHFYETQAAQGMEFRNLATLYGHPLVSGEALIANQAESDPRRGGLPPGHPPLRAYLGVPITHGGELVAMIGLANRAGGYDRGLLDFLQPLLLTLGQLMEATRSELKYRQHQIELARLSRVASETTNGVIITDAQGRVEWINEGFTRISGYTLEEMLGRRPGDVLQGPDTDAAAVAQIRAALARKEAFNQELINYGKSGRAYWIQISCNPLRDAAGVLQGFMAIESDITERRRIERIKDEFVSTVSHELRTPLTVIAGSLGLLAAGVLERKPERAREMIEVAYKNSQRLTVLINDLLDMEKLAAGKMHFELRREDLCGLLRQAVEENQNYAEQHGTRLELAECEQDVPVRVDAQRLLQVLANLLSNAAKFSPPGVAVLLRMRTAGAWARVEVEDHGPGIPESFRARVFEKFAQADATSTRLKGGTGLGLAITRELVEGMGGQIGFESVEGQGSTFHFQLPIDASSGPAGAEARL